ncbi:MAG: Lrp/AsnC family transcriptional regulator [Candidatus Kariarchaeaceae archaeon]|jgi:DNA-binding Lrp family transcriptional regulator
MTTNAFILLNVVLGKESELLDKLKTLAEVQEGYIVMGSFDIIIKVEVSDAKDLRPLVTNKIRTLGGVRQTMTVIII